MSRSTNGSWRPWPISRKSSRALYAFAGLDEQLAAVAVALETHAPAHQALLTHRQLADSLETRRQAVEDAKGSHGRTGRPTEQER